MKSLVVVISIHHDNTVKIGKAIASEIDAEFKTPKEVDEEKISEYDLIGFGF